MKTSSIRIEGNILSPELFDKLDSTDILGQNPVDFGFDRSFKVKDDIARAWADAKDQWNIFKRRIDKLSENATGVEETKKNWGQPSYQRSAPAAAKTDQASPTTKAATQTTAAKTGAASPVAMIKVATPAANATTSVPSTTTSVLPVAKAATSSTSTAQATLVAKPKIVADTSAPTDAASTGVKKPVPKKKTPAKKKTGEKK